MNIANRSLTMLAYGIASAIWRETCVPIADPCNQPVLINCVPRDRLFEDRAKASAGRMNRYATTAMEAYWVVGDECGDPDK